MNDLTKEELEHILQLVNDYEYKCENEITDLPGKIQSMIDNYNQHQFKVPDDMESSWLAWKYQNE